MSSFRKVKDSLADAALNEILARGAPILGTFSELTSMISNTISLDVFLDLFWSHSYKKFQALWTIA